MEFFTFFSKVLYLIISRLYLFMMYKSNSTGSSDNFIAKSRRTYFFVYSAQCFNLHHITTMYFNYQEILLHFILQKTVKYGNFK